MHIVHLVDALFLGGAERMLVEIANRTVVDGHRVTVCVTRSGTTLAARLDPRIELLVLGRRGRLDLAPLVRFARWVRAHRVDVLHCHGRSSFSLAAAVRATGAIRTRIVLHDHYGVELDGSVPRWFRFARRFCDAYVGVYDNHLAWARRAGIPDARCVVIPNAFDMDALARTPPSEPLPKVNARARLIVIGGIRREKAIDVLLEALARVRDVHTFIVGGDADLDYAEACRVRASRPDLAGRVTFLGQREDALALAATADLAVHPSRSESGPIVVAEYAALGIPYVATHVGGIAEALARAQAGRFVAADDPEALARAIEEMVAMPAAERRTLARGWTVAARQFDISVVMPRWYDVYAGVLA